MAAENKGHLSKIAAVLLIVLLASAFALSVVFAIGPSYMGDDVAYAFFAHRVDIGQFKQASGDILSIRIMQIYPIALFYSMLGVNAVSSAMWDTLALLGTVAVTFFIGKEVYNESVGLLSAFLLALSPIANTLSVTMSDNVPMMFFASLGMLGLLYGERRESRAWYAISGIAFMASVLVMPEGLIALATGVLYLLVQIARKKAKAGRALPFFACGLLIAFAITCAFNYANVGNPLITFTSTFSFYQSQSGTNVIAPANTYLAFYPETMFPYNVLATLQRDLGSGIFNPVRIWDDIDVANYNVVGFLFYIVIIAAAYLALRKERGAYFPLFWAIVGLLLLEFDPLHISLAPFVYTLQHRLSRYLTLVAPPVAIIISIALVRLLQGHEKRIMRYAAVAFVALAVLFIAYTSLQVTGLWYSINAYERFDQVAIAKYLDRLPNETPVYYLNGFGFTEIYMRFSNMSRFYIYDQIDNCSKIPGGAYIIIPKNEQVFSIPFTPDPTRYCPEWQLVYVPEINSMYPYYISGPAMVSEAVLYYVPENTIAQS
jgi:4-amino-4-deoxy-L-arabinose transferase-like glycosyltransferase